MKKSPIFLGLTLFILTACGGTSSQSSTTSSSEDLSSNITSEPLKTTYLEIEEAPNYLTISESKLNEYKTFYIDSIGGDDANAGTSTNAPLKSIASIHSIITKYGSLQPLRILLKRGSSFTGNIVLAGYEASEEYPLILDAYGDKKDGYPIINGVGNDATILTNAIIWLQEDNTRIMNLELTGPQNSRGIYVLPRKSGVYKNIVVKDNYLHDINWNWSYPESPDNTDPSTINPENVTSYNSVNRYRRLYGGIEFFTGTVDVQASLNAGPMSFDSIFIENNRLENLSQVAINVYNYWVNRGGVGYGYNKFVPEDPFYQNYETGVGYFPSRNIVIRNNYTNCIGGDGIVVNGSINVWLDNNTSYKSSYLGRSGFFNAGIWLHNTINGYIINNEAAYTYLQHGAGDGQGFDIDNACENIYFYNNYAHHNEGGGLLLCNQQTVLFVYDVKGNLTNPNKVMMMGEWKNNYIRNNVFVNNGIATNRTRSAFITTARNVSDVVAENNTVILGNIERQHIINCEDNVTSVNHVYRNNIFYSPFAGTNPVFANQTLANPIFEGNLYYNVASGNSLENQLVLSDDPKAITDLDPKFTLPEIYKGYEVSHSFEPGISLLNIASQLEAQLLYDIAGNRTEGLNYLGAIAK